MADRFPLHLLPQTALSNVLLCMRSIDCLFYSQCTQRCKRSVVALNFLVSYFRIIFKDNYVNLHMKLPDNATVDISAYDLPHEHINLEVAQDFLVLHRHSRGEENGWNERVREERAEVEENEENVEGDEDGQEENVPNEIFGDEGDEEEVNEEHEEEAAHDVENVGGPDEQEASDVITLKALYLKYSPFYCTFTHFLSIKDWFEHCKRIYHLKWINSFELYDTDYQLDMAQVGRIVDGMRIGLVESYTISFDAFQQLLALHLSAEDILLVTEMIDLKREFVKKTIIENMEYVIGDLFDNESSISLDEILLTNASGVHICYNERIDGKDLNRFVRCWMRGSNRRFKVLRFTPSDDTILDENVVLKGVRHTKVSWKRWTQKLIENRYRKYGVPRGSIICNIRSVHGREATIAFGTNQATFIVWD